MKRFVVVILLIVTGISLCACGAGGVGAAPAETPAPTPTPSPYEALIWPDGIWLGMSMQEVRGILPDGAKTKDDSIEFINSEVKGSEIGLPNDYSVRKTEYGFNEGKLFTVDFQIVHSGDAKEIDGEPVTTHEFNNIVNYITEKYGNSAEQSDDKHLLRAKWTLDDGTVVLLGASTLADAGEIALRYADDVAGDVKAAEDGFWTQYFGDAVLDGVKKGAEDVLEALLDGLDED